MEKYDYLVVGSGLFGATFAHEAKGAGKTSEWKPGDEPYYPVNDEKNGKLYEQYHQLAQKEEKVLFGGRLGEYKYYDMDKAIASALRFSKTVLSQYT